MPTFKEYRYARPVIEELEAEFNRLLSAFSRADSCAGQEAAMEEINSLRSEFESMATLARIRHSLDTTDPYYRTENDFFDELAPVYEGLIHRYYQALVASPHRSALEARWGKQLFRLAELQLKTFSPEIIADLQTENRMVSEYTRLRASAQIWFEGQERNLAQMEPFMEAKERALRKSAQEAYTGFFLENEEQFDQIYDQLVKVRDRIARKLGFENFVELGYARLGRSDYNAEMVAGYRRQIREKLVPLATKLRQRQAERLQLPKLKYYDEPLTFLTGNALPQGGPEWILERGQQMYNELSPETGEFFSYMVESELLDLLAKKGKAGGGYATYISKYQAPFIFANFNGTSGDIDVLTHEVGHAFQVYCSRHFKVPEYYWPTLEACEIHSMSMEFIAWPWMHLFFEEDELKYKFAHLSAALLFIPYGATVDQFQHWVYEQPEASPAERKEAWRKIEREYLVHRDYEDNELLNRGGYWFRQGHIFTNPFYYIDYTLAQVCALQFWVKTQLCRAAAWQDYLRLCQAGGSRSFLELVALAGLKNPFAAGSIEAILPAAEEWLAGVDDREL
ncbi:MAG: M3 family oligoendopeptidase [Firmicutes bacterium]|nr:M3 family oligoendopeptidase [Bacillota bacterium]